MVQESEKWCSTPTALMTITKRYWESAQVFGISITTKKQRKDKKISPVAQVDSRPRRRMWMYISALSGKSITLLAGVNHVHPRSQFLLEVYFIKVCLAVTVKTSSLLLLLYNGTRIFSNNFHSSSGIKGYVKERVVKNSHMIQKACCYVAHV